MPKVTAQDLDFCVEQIVEAATNWNTYPGFGGERCGGCYAEANVLADGPGWFCPCGHWNMQCRNHQRPHEEPTFGPMACTIKRAHRIVTSVYAGHQKGKRWIKK
jgi:hypothetical protein